jgi:DNA-binding LacI/PurR family transcriptional regulator
MSLDGQERAAAFKEALAQNNVPLPPEWIQPGNLSVEGGQAAMMRMLDAPSGPPTAVVAANDRMALGAIQALHDRGLSAPHDCSVIGFDDIDAAQFCSPPLTTIQVSPRAMAETVTSILMEDLALEADERQGRTVRVPASLVMRASTGAPALRS